MGMNKRAINANIFRKIKEWISTIQDPTVAKVAQENVIVTGGCITSMLLGEDVNDYDVYFKTYEAAEIVARYYVSQFNQEHNNKNASIVMTGKNYEYKIWLEGVGSESYEEDSMPTYDDWWANLSDDSREYLNKTEESRPRIWIQSAGVAGEKPVNDASPDEDPEARSKAEEEGLDYDKNYRPVFLSSNAITLSSKLQIVIRFAGEPDKIHENYDFVHCTNYWTWGKGIALNSDAMEATLARELRYVGSRYPLCSLIRTRKFLQRGWKINAGQYVKMAVNLGEFNLENPYVLADQLTGVDVAYFSWLITQCKKPGVEVTTAYITELIDKIF